MKKAIGILGGMGPEASGYMYRLLIEMAIAEFGAKHNDDFPEILLYSIPVPDFISSEKEKEKALKMLIERVKLLNHMELSRLGIACNTAHLLLPALQKVSDTPFISMIDEVSSEVERKELKTVGILGTPTTIRSKLYQTALTEKNIVTIEPTEKQLEKLEGMIRAVIAGRQTETDVQQLIHIADNLVKQGAEGIILGCTELPLLFLKEYAVPVFSSLEILSRSLLNVYYQTERATIRL